LFIYFAELCAMQNCRTPKELSSSFFDQLANFFLDRLANNCFITLIEYLYISGDTMKLALTALILLSSVSSLAIANELPSWMNERKIQGENNLQPTSELRTSQIYGTLRGVAIVEKSYGRGFCTANRVGEDLFMTNFHCEDAIPCEDVQIRMGYEEGIDKEEQQVFKCVEVLAKNLKFDYALYRVEKLNELPNTVEEYPILELEAAELTQNMLVTVAGHPRGRMKEADVSENCVISDPTIVSMAGRSTLKHLCDTEGGNSGSAIIDAATGHMIGIHWGGMTDKFNLAIPMYLVLEDIKSKVSEKEYAELNIAN